VSTPLPADGASRTRHLRHLRELLHDPLVLTADSLKGELTGLDELRLFSVDNLKSVSGQSSHPRHIDNLQNNMDEMQSGNKQIAFMMLTSGSTGNAKSVEITHAQALASVEGKSQMLGTSPGSDTFLNWIGERSFLHQLSPAPWLAGSGGPIDLDGYHIHSSLRNQKQQFTYIK
jgi:acyl-CoA synthetase (AMP-forming)/AMP-acid ligase II